ncbi:MAG: macro domain-containing protein [Treponema sp.]|nr:macro domain-containing protein [Treponema sp.]
MPLRSPQNHDTPPIASCRRSCLALACRSAVESAAFCCISAGGISFPQ